MLKFLFLLTIIVNTQIEQDFKKAIMQKNEVASIYENLGKDNIDLAINLYLSSKKYGISPFIYFYLGKVYTLKNNTEFAEFNFRNSVNTSHNLAESVVLLELFEKEGKISFVEELYGKISDFKWDSGAKRLPNLSNYFFHKGLSSLERGNDEDAYRNFNFSALLDPTALEPKASLLKKHLSSFNLKFVDDIFQYVNTLFKSFENQYILSLNIYFYLTVTLAISFIFFICLLLIRHLGSIYHHIAEIIPRSLPGFVRTIVGTILILLPVIWGVRLTWLILLALIAACLFAKKTEKVLIVCFAILLILSPIIVKLETNFFAVKSETTFHLSNAQSSAYNKDLLQKLYSYAEVNPSADIFFSIGILEKRGGQFDAAKEAYRKALSVRESSIFHNNLGNVFFVQQDYASAVIEYRRAIELEPQRGAPHYNLAQVYLKKLMLPESTSEFRLANELDFELISEFAHQAKEQYNRMTIDETLNPTELWRNISMRKKGETSLFSTLLCEAPKTLSMAGISILVVLILCSAFLKNFSQSCSICGSPICNRCKKEMEALLLCKECKGMVGATKSIVIQEKMKKNIRDRKGRLQKIVASILSVFPGGGWIYYGLSMRGFFMIIITVLLLSIIFFNCPVFHSGTFSHYVETQSSRISAGLVLLIIFSLNMIFILKRCGDELWR